MATTSKETDKKECPLKVLWRSLISPFEVILQHKVEFTLWFTFVIFAGQLGIIVNLISRCFFTDIDYRISIYIDSLSGNFYTFSLVLIASLLGPIFIRNLKKEEKEFRKLVMLFIALLIFLLLFNAVFFSVATRDVIDQYKTLDASQLKVDMPQLVFFVLSILVAIYAFGVERLPLHKEYDDLNRALEEGDFKQANDKEIATLESAAGNLPADPSIPKL